MPTNHSFQVARREPGYRIDRLLFTTDSSYTPSTDGPPESIRTGSSSPQRTIAIQVLNETGIMSSVEAVLNESQTVNPIDGWQIFNQLSREQDHCLNFTLLIPFAG